MYTIGNVIRLAITFTPIIIYTTNNVTQSTFDHSITHTIWLHIYMAHTWRTPTCFSCPLLLSPCIPLCSPFVFPSTYLAPSSCDRNRLPPSQVACKLTPFAPPFTQLTHPPQIPRTPPALRLTTTTSGIFRLLLSGTNTLLTLCAEQVYVDKYFYVTKIEMGNHPFLLFSYIPGSLGV